MKGYELDVEQGERFEFGKNWQKFLSRINEAAILVAENSLKEMFRLHDFSGKRFLDIGSGSGLFSLAARRLGARVYSFDYDPHSVACTLELRRRYLPDDPDWTICPGSVLDVDYLKSLGAHDLVYAWGVLHHTGQMWQALANVQLPVAAQGRLCVAIYNDQGIRSILWRRIKKIFCSGLLGKTSIILVFFPYYIMRGIAADLLKMKNPLRRYLDSYERGMSLVTDWVDWLGGLPFEVAKPEDIFVFYRDRGFDLINLKTCGGGHGNNQFVFERTKHD
jgi:2-polyprenyl-3-methyl-5-hydroxy-6-metoxy-1,4-benzoquinol methylase